MCTLASTLDALLGNRARGHEASSMYFTCEFISELRSCLQVAQICMCKELVAANTLHKVRKHQSLEPCATINYMLQIGSAV